MKFKSLGYCIVQGFKNIGRNRSFSLASVATMSLCIFILGLVYAVTSNLQYMVNRMSDSLCVKVFFDEGITDEEIEIIGKEIKSRNEVTVVHFTSAEEAWEQYKEDYLGEEYLYLAEGFGDDNPLADSQSYEVYFNDSAMQKSLVSYISNLQGVRRVNSSEVTADSLTEISKLVGIVSAFILIILLLIALFLINNTISTGISVRRKEIDIMRLLGARNGFIRAPFIVEGIIIGLIGCVIPLIIVFALYENMTDFLISKFNFIAGILDFIPVMEFMTKFTPVALVLGIGLGLIGSIISVSRNLSK